MFIEELPNDNARVEITDFAAVAGAEARRHPANGGRRPRWHLLLFDVSSEADSPTTAGGWLH